MTEATSRHDIVSMNQSSSTPKYTYLSDMTVQSSQRNLRKHLLTKVHSNLK